MVKKAKEPVIADNAKYYAVAYPYPLNPNWVFDHDQVACARWVVEAIGNPSYLEGIRYKPRQAHGIIILVISKEFTDHARLLGEHRWSEILTDPPSELKRRVSQVFHSTYSTVREVEKDGWKAMSMGNFQSAFQDWEPGTEEFTYPFPATHWCPVPAEDITNKPMCRPLPIKVKPPPPKEPAPVVGSSQWVDTQATAPPSKAELKSGWAHKVAPINTCQTNSASLRPTLQSAAPLLSPPAPTRNLVPLKSSKSASSSQVPPQSATQGPQPSSAGPSARSKTARSKPIPVQQFNSGDQKKGPKPTWNQASVPTQPAVDPTWEKPKPANAWAQPIKLTPDPKPIKVVPVEPSPWGDPSPGTSASLGNAWDGYSLHGQSWADSVVTPVSGNTPLSTRPPSPIMDQYNGQFSLVGKRNKGKTRVAAPHTPCEPELDIQDDDQHGGMVPSPSHFFEDEDEHIDGEVAVLNPWERDMIATEEVVGPAQRVAGDFENLWADHEEDNGPKAPELLCPTHGLACKKGICRDMSKLVKEEEKKKREAERKQRQEAGGNKKRGPGKNRSSNNTSRSRNGYGRGEPEVDDEGFTQAGNWRESGDQAQTGGDYVPGRMRGFDNGE